MIVVMPDAHAIPPGAAGFEEYGPANSGALCRRNSLQDIMCLWWNRTTRVDAPSRSPWIRRAFHGRASRA
jgi:hypothetical protein